MDDYKKLPDSRSKLHSFNWLGDIPGDKAASDVVEVQFKNARKGYYRNTTGLDLAVGDMVAVEATPGHDIGRVTLLGLLAERRMRHAAGRREKEEVRRVFRKAKPADIEKFEEAKARENDTMIKARKIAASLNLNMKIGDVEYQGDGNKAIFYYIADERVDFRQLIKVLAETFKVRIEMKQIGVRQEAGRIGGLGPCGRPLCCSQWMTNFVSVATSAARFQDLSLNPQKLAGQCAKLKCCLNFEVDAYVEASKKVPPKEIRLETADSTWFHFKTDIFKRVITYSTDKNLAANLTTISADRAFEVIRMNKAGEKPLTLAPEEDENKSRGKTKTEFGDILGDDDLTRFDKKKKRKRNKGNGNNKPEGRDGNPEKRKANDKPKTPDKPKSEKAPEGGAAQGAASGDAPRKNRDKRPARKPRAARKDGPGDNNSGNSNAPKE